MQVRKAVIPDDIRVRGGWVVVVVTHTCSSVVVPTRLVTTDEQTRASEGGCAVSADDVCCAYSHSGLLFFVFLCWQLLQRLVKERRLMLTPAQDYDDSYAAAMRFLSNGCASVTPTTFCPALPALPVCCPAAQQPPPDVCSARLHTCVPACVLAVHQLDARCGAVLYYAVLRCAGTQLNTQSATQAQSSSQTTCSATTSTSTLATGANSERGCERTA